MNKLYCLCSLFVLSFLLDACHHSRSIASFESGNSMLQETETLLKQDILKEADWAMQQPPITVTAESSTRSAGGLHDFFSEADYFWPDPKNPDGPYINRDGLTNPQNFLAHRKAMIRFSKIIGALASAFKITLDKKYVLHAMVHLKAWFTDAATMMNPHLRYAQAVRGSSIGRSWGIIDTIHLMEVAQGIITMEGAAIIDDKTLAGLKAWFLKYIVWLNTDKNGIAEKTSLNNHSTCWVMQVASFANLCKDTAMLDSCKLRYKTVLLPNQMALNGSFPLETARTKPYGYSLFNLDAMASICQILSTPTDNLWTYKTPDGRCIMTAIKYLYPYVHNKNAWPFKPDVMYWQDWPVAQPFLIFGAIAYQQKEWFGTWKILPHTTTVEEVTRNLPIRHPLIWL